MHVSLDHPKKYPARTATWLSGPNLWGLHLLSRPMGLQNIEMIQAGSARSVRFQPSYCIYLHLHNSSCTTKVSYTLLWVSDRGKPHARPQIDHYSAKGICVYDGGWEPLLGVAKGGLSQGVLKCIVLLQFGAMEATNDQNSSLTTGIACTKDPFKFWNATHPGSPTPWVTE